MPKSPTLSTMAKVTAHVMTHATTIPQIIKAVGLPDHGPNRQRIKKMLNELADVGLVKQLGFEVKDELEPKKGPRLMMYGKAD